MSNIERIKAEIERRREANKRQYLSSSGDMSWQRMCGEEDCLVELLAFINSLPEEKPIEKDEEMEALIACDIMEATVKRVNIDKQDKDKEEEAMLEKINYLRNLGLNE